MAEVSFTEFWLFEDENCSFFQSYLLSVPKVEGADLCTLQQPFPMDRKSKGARWFFGFGWLVGWFCLGFFLFFPNLRHSLDLPEINRYLNREFSIENLPFLSSQL